MCKNMLRTSGNLGFKSRHGIGRRIQKRDCKSSLTNYVKKDIFPYVLHFVQSFGWDFEFVLSLNDFFLNRHPLESGMEIATLIYVHFFTMSLPKQKISPSCLMTTTVGTIIYPDKQWSFGFNGLHLTSSFLSPHLYFGCSICSVDPPPSLIR